MSYIPSRGYRDNWRSKVSEEKDLQEDLDMMITTRVHRHRSVHSTTAREMIDLCRDERGKWHWPVNGADLVFPGIYLGDETTALCTGILRGLGVTAVLNAAQGNLEGWSMVNTKASFYKPHSIQFLGVQAVDLKSFPITDYFHEAADWIENIIKSGGVVFVHCVQGISRSATLILAYLIIKKNMKLQDAIAILKKNRSIAPNEGFMLQLIELNDDVHKLLKSSTIQK